MKSAHLLLFFLFFSFFAFFFPPQSVHAEGDPFYEQNPLIIDQQVQAIRKSDAENHQTSIYGGNVSAHSMIGGLDALRVMTLGRTIDAPEFKNETGAVRQLASAMGEFYAHPPASGIAYTRKVLADIGLAPKAYAQGIGFTGLLPLLPLWVAFRNIAYSILIIVMFVIGFMVIFRMKIDPKTVISIQAALPKIILALILITFSYPIAGFLIDLMYVAMALVLSLLAHAVLPLKTSLELTGPLEFMTNSTALQEKFITGGYPELIGNVMFRWELFGSLLKNIFLGSAGNTLTFEVGIPLIIGAIMGGWPAVIAAALPTLLIIVFLGLALLFVLIRLTFLLLNSYIQIIVAIVLSPILLLQEAIPGRSAFTQWIQNLVANLIVFPATVLIIYASWLFTAVSIKGGLWVPPLTPAGGGGDIGGSGNPLGVFLGLGIIFMAPNLVAQIKKAFHPSGALPLSTGSAFSPLTGGVSTGMGAMSQFYYMQQLWGGHGQEGILQTALKKVIPGIGDKDKRE